MQTDTSSASDPVELMNERALSQLTKLSLATIRRLRWSGKGPKSLRIGNSVRYRRRDVEQWIQQAEEPFVGAGD